MNLAGSSPGDAGDRGCEYTMFLLILVVECNYILLYYNSQCIVMCVLLISDLIFCILCFCVLYMFYAVLCPSTYLDHWCNSVYK